MKLAGDRVDRFVARPDPTVDLILLHGDDAGLAGERAGRLARGVVDDPGDPFRVTELEPERLRGDPGLLLEEAQSLSLLGGRRLVRVRRAADLISPAVRLLLAADRLAAVVLLEAGELPGSSSLRKLIEAAPRAMALHCRRDEPDAVAALVRRHLAEHGLSIGDEALDHLVANLGADRGLTRQELDKLALYVGDREDRRLDLADIAAIVDDSAALALDDLQRAALLDAPELAGLLDRLLDQGLRPEAVMRTTAMAAAVTTSR